MRKVYKVRDQRLDRSVAIKTSKGQFSERFASEARTAAASGDIVRVRKACQDFLALWKDAASDIPSLITGKKNCAALH
ncbi:MAG: hypothetical protein ACRD5L_05800 [Bryobacteraceae bacterium]